MTTVKVMLLRILLVLDHFRNAIIQYPARQFLQMKFKYNYCF